MTATGRQHSVANGCFREAKLQRRLFGDELEKVAVLSRPKAEVAIFSPYDTMQRELPLAGLY